MAAGRTLKSLISRRRRAGDEGEDEDGPVAVEDSQSEGSVGSDAEHDEVDGSSVGGASGVQPSSADSAQVKRDTATNGSTTKKSRKSRKKVAKTSKDASESPHEQTSFKAMADTSAMMNGLRIGDVSPAQQEAVDFESMDPISNTETAPTVSNGHAVLPVERQKREHEEYRKKRDADPAFIPNRGNFFMHDTRGHANGQAPPFRGAWQGRGRGRGGANVGGVFAPSNQTAPPEKPEQQPWKHDLHDTINEEVQAQPSASALNSTDNLSTLSDTARLFPKLATQPFQPQPRVLSFSSSTLVGKVQIRVALPGTKAPVAFSDIPWKHYIRLPDHRPPLRRDKPVRVSLPGHNQRYIFPSTDRSFIFIPRQMRPNQQGYQNGRYQRSAGGYGYSSRRTSMYGGSMYSASVAASRRSSMAGISRDHAFSPVGSFTGIPSNRPVVRLPHGVQHLSAVSTPIGPLSGQQTPTGYSQLHTFPLPQKPTFQGTPTTTVHQPRPQKAISVTGIESPAVLQQAPSEPQPFQNQLPAHMNEQTVYVQHPQQPPPPYFSPQEQYQYPHHHPQVGTPLSGIPEQAMHAPPFQPPGYGPPPYYAAYPPQQSMYYSPLVPNGYPSMPMYMAPPPQGYMVPQAPSMPPQAPPPLQETPSQQSEEQQLESQPPSGMVAHESNGMVFYVPASEAQQAEQYQPAESFVPSYAMPGLAPPTPAPEDTTAYYYSQMPHAGMQEVGSAVYYPAQQ